MFMYQAVELYSIPCERQSQYHLNAFETRLNPEKQFSRTA